jgi:hypothetical protein
MSITTYNNGRLGNQIIRNLATSLIAEKYDLHVTYSHHEAIQELGIHLFSGQNKYDDTILLTDDNYFDVLESNNVTTNINPNNNYFQARKIMNFLYRHIHSDNVKNSIIHKNPVNNRYNNNNDAFVHVRLTDAAQHNPGIQYYLNVLKDIQFDTLYISSDNIQYHIIRDIVKTYPHNTKIVYMNEISTIQFASTCKHIVLSHGSFSAVIGYLSFFSDVHYPEYEPGKIWYGDMFSIEGWMKHHT